jgi:uncharacterized membrane protein YphA (DoxX/SURF4 family)
MPGLALLLLRLTLGATIIAQGILYLLNFHNPLVSIRLIAAGFILAGTSLFIGLMTSTAAIIIVGGTIGTAISIFPTAPNSLIEPPICAIYVTVTAIVIWLIGPGAFSLDALIFGRREINIPGKFNPPKS